MRRVLRLFSTDYYRLLNLPHSATKAEVKKAYLSLAKQYHPDAQTGNEEKFKNIAEAYSVLMDDSKRAAFDHKRLKTHAWTAPHKAREPKMSSYDEQQRREQVWASYWTQASNPWGGTKTPNKDKQGYKDEDSPMGAIMDMVGFAAFAGILTGICYYLYKIGAHFARSEPEIVVNVPTIKLRVPERKAIDLGGDPVEQVKSARVSRSKFSESS
jgi:curved DNA-binding protein CbpA